MRMRMRVQDLSKNEKILLFKALCTHINFLDHNNLRPEEEQGARLLRIKLAQIMADEIDPNTDVEHS